MARPARVAVVVIVLLATALVLSILFRAAPRAGVVFLVGVVASATALSFARLMRSPAQAGERVSGLTWLAYWLR